ncbi:hypothetical protein T484DRAFT_1834212, partial [Baffinella frigidus]
MASTAQARSTATRCSPAHRRTTAPPAVAFISRPQPFRTILAAVLCLATLLGVSGAELRVPSVMAGGMRGAEAAQAAIVTAEAANKAGNDLFGRQLFDEAIASYSAAEKGLRRFTQTGDHPPAEVVLCKVLCNRAAASLGAGYHREALSDCDAALCLDPALGKAVLRRGMARESLGQHEDAHADAVNAMELFGFGTPMGDKALGLRRRLDKLIAQRERAPRRLDKLLAQRERAPVIHSPFCLNVEAQPTHLFNRDQTLRLNFHTPPPAAIALRAYFQVKVFIANEFGLFRPVKVFIANEFGLFGPELFAERNPEPLLLSITPLSASGPASLQEGPDSGIRIETRPGQTLQVHKRGKVTDGALQVDKRGKVCVDMRFVRAAPAADKSTSGDKSTAGDKSTSSDKLPSEPSTLGDQLPPGSCGAANEGADATLDATASPEDEIHDVGQVRLWAR